MRFTTSRIDGARDISLQSDELTRASMRSSKCRAIFQLDASARSFGSAVATLLGALALCACGAAEEPVEPLALSSASQGILRGSVDNDHPEVMLLADAAGFLCTGTNIRNDGNSGFLLTAAHCVTEDAQRGPGVVPVAAERFVVVPGTDFSESQIAFPAEAISVEPGYDGTFAQDDIAVVRYTFGNADAPGVIEPLFEDDDELTVNDELLLIGYGQTEDPELLNTERRQVDRTVDALDVELIAFSQQDSIGACFGDSGGPGLVEVGGDERVAAVISGGVDSSDTCEGGIGIAMRASAYEDFIEDAIAGD
jgi:hypothetical protein